jgi:hypothetical protein
MDIASRRRRPRELQALGCLADKDDMSGCP